MDKEEMLEQLEKKFGDYMEKEGLSDLVLENMSTKEYDALINRISKSFIESFKEVFTEELMDGKPMYYSTYDEVLTPVIKRMFNSVMNVTRLYTDLSYKLSGLNTKSILPTFTKVANQIKYLKEELCNQELEYQQIVKVIEDFIPSTNKYFVDEFMRDNAEIQSDLGFKPIVKRYAFYNACDWCKDKEGVYDYDEVKDKGNDVWLRHRACNCTIVFENEFFKRNVNTGKQVAKASKKVLKGK